MIVQRVQRVRVCLYVFYVYVFEKMQRKQLFTRMLDHLPVGFCELSDRSLLEVCCRCLHRCVIAGLFDYL